VLDGGGWLTPRPSRFTPRKQTRYPLYKRLGGTQDRSGRMRKISPPAGIRSQDGPARSKTLYGLSYTILVHRPENQEFTEDLCVMLHEPKHFNFGPCLCSNMLVGRAVWCGRFKKCLNFNDMQGEYRIHMTPSRDPILRHITSDLFYSPTLILSYLSIPHILTCYMLCLSHSPCDHPNNVW
jgi:hypothetical protein